MSFVAAISDWPHETSARIECVASTLRTLITAIERDAARDQRLDDWSNVLRMSVRDLEAIADIVSTDEAKKEIADRACQDERRAAE